MKKLIGVLLIPIFFLACKKVEFAPEGPTDVRVKNVSNLIFNETVINTTGGIHNIGTIYAGDTSEYFRFEIAYPKAEISARINGVLFSTGPVDVTYMQYIGQERITYVVGAIQGSKLEIRDVIYEEPLKLK